MKKLLCVVVASILIVTLLGACNFKQQTVEETTAATDNQLPTATTHTDNHSYFEETTSSETFVTTRFKTLDDYVNSDIIQKQIEDNKGSFSEVVDLEVFAEGGDTMVYKYTYKSSYDESDVESIKKGVNNIMDNQTNLYTSLINEIENVTEVKNAKVKICYYLPDGTLITEKTFEKE